MVGDQQLAPLVSHLLQLVILVIMISFFYLFKIFEQISKTEYTSLFEQLDFAYSRTINLGNEFWRFLEINGNHHLCLYHQLNKQFIMYKPDVSLLCFPWPYDGIIDVSWSKTTNTWIVATQAQIVNKFLF
jgi:hypothetical protein